MRDITTEPPDTINAQGVKWWHEPDLTRYALSRGFAGAQVWTVERPDGYRTRLFTQGATLLAEDQTLDGLSLKIALLAFERESDARHNPDITSPPCCG